MGGVSFSASSEEGITHPVTTQVLSTCTICVRLWSGEKPPRREGLSCRPSAVPEAGGGPVREAQCSLRPGGAWRGAPRARTPQRVTTGRRGGGEISQPSSVSQAFGRRPPTPGHL